MRHFQTFGLLALLGFSASPAFGGAWTQDEGRARVIVSGSYYHSSERYNNSGHRQGTPNYGRYELNPYIEYGLYDDVTLGANLSLQRASQNVPGASANVHWGLGETELFARKRMWRQGGLVASVEPMLKLPAPDSRDLPPLGSPNADIGLGGSLGYGRSLFGYHHFANLDTQYRHRFGRQRDQLRMGATLGIGVAPQWTVMPQAFLTYRTSDPGVAGFTQSNADDYHLTRLQLSGVYALSEGLKLQGGAFADVAGTNAGAGQGVLFSVWKHF